MVKRHRILFLLLVVVVAPHCADNLCCFQGFLSVGLVGRLARSSLRILFALKHLSEFLLLLLSSHILLLLLQSELHSLNLLHDFLVSGACLAGSCHRCGAHSRKVQLLLRTGQMWKPLDGDLLLLDEEVVLVGVAVGSQQTREQLLLLLLVFQSS